MTDSMPQKRYPFMRHEKNRHGNWRWYVRRGSKRIRLPNDYGTDDFWEAYEAAVKGEKIVKPVKSGSLAWLVERYKDSVQFTQGATTTRYFRSRTLQRVVEAAGPMQFANVSAAQIHKGMDDRAAAPHTANHFLTAMRLLFDWAKLNGHVKINPCDGIKPLRIKIIGHPVWSIEQVEQYRARHKVGTRARLAIDMLLFTGLRVSDVIRIGRQHVRQGVLSIKTKKTNTQVHIPIFAELRASIDASPTSDLTFLTAQRGRPFQAPQSFTAWFAKRCEEAGLAGTGLSAHGLRKAGATIAADDGASPHELMAMFGWTRIAMAEVYTKEADRRRLARVAAERIANTFAPHPENEVAAPEAGPVEK